MIRFLRVVFFALVALILLGFAFANRHDVIVSFDPFAAIDNAALSIAAPLFAVVIVAAMLGIVAGAFATWLSQRHQNRIEADKWRAQAEALKTARARETSHPALPGNS
jgi:hypothetical protein